MDWLWPLYKEYVTRAAGRRSAKPSASEMQALFFEYITTSTATLYVMEPVGDTIRFKGLGRWPIPEVPDLLADPNAFIADRFGGGKYKVNFHHGATFVGTHNFRTYGDARWRLMQDLVFE